MAVKTLRVIFQICLGAFCLTALVGAVMSVRREDAFAWLVGFCICYALLLALRNIGAGSLSWLMLFSAGLSAAYLINRDWEAREGWIAVLTPIYRGLAMLHLPMDLIRPHSADGAMLALVPLQIAAVRTRYAAGRSTWMWMATAAFAFMMLIGGASKGTLLLLPAAIAAGMWGTRLFPGQVLGRLILPPWSWGVLTLCALFSGPLARIVVVERPWLSTSIEFAFDYWLTGVGIGNFPLAFSLYRAVLPTPYLPSAQNLFLDVWLGHGVTGLIAFVGLCMAAWSIGVRLLRRDHGIDVVWRAAALGSLLVVLVQGMFDDPYYDGGRMLPVLGVVLAVVVRETRSCASVPGRDEVSGVTVPPVMAMLAGRGRTFSYGLTLCAASLVVVLAAQPVVRAAVLANIGAVLQTRVELRVIGDAPANDVTRRGVAAKLMTAEWFFRRALEIDDGNALAHLRLGQLMLIRRELSGARGHLEAAWSANPNGRAERLLFGETLWRLGNIAGADSMWRGVRQWEFSIEARRTQE